MSAHTPGPWSYQPSGENIIEPSVVILDNDNGCGDPECCGERSYWVEIKPEDARLIAAAPELLAALIQIHRMGYTDFGDRLMVEAAISKATGEPA